MNGAVPGLVDALSLGLVGLGSFFYSAGALGLVRLPDIFTRLHALPKADNLGLGFLVSGTALQAGTLYHIAQLALIWGLMLAASGVSAQLVARAALLRAGLWKGRDVS